jgi:hypothetical protein
MECILAAAWHFGLDLGQRKDHSAIVVVESQVVAVGGRDAVTYEPVVERRKRVRHVERIARGTQFQSVVNQMAAMTQSARFQAGDVYTCVDGTGLGAPVVESLRYGGLRGELVPVLFTGGEVTRYGEGYYRVPKGELLHGLAMELERKDLALARGVGAMGELLEELRGMRKSYGSAGARWTSTGKHDDLVMALVLAVWSAKRRELPLSGELLRRRR